MQTRHILSVLLKNTSGALSRVVGLFSARGYNIESLTVAPTESDSISRMTIVSYADEKKMERTRAIILSMTPKERDNPQIINSSRKRRIALGSGTTVQEINQLLKQFEQTKLLMKQMKGGKGRMRLPF